jgi:hypothetical protein
MSDSQWKYINYGIDEPYKVYTISLVVDNPPS